MITNRIIFERTDNINGRICNTPIYENEIRKKYGKDYFDMNRNEKKECEEYFCKGENIYF